MAQTQIPQTVQQWNITSQDGKDGFNALQFNEQPLGELGDGQVLVKSECLQQPNCLESLANPTRQSRAHPSTCVFPPVADSQPGFPLTNSVTVP